MAPKQPTTTTQISKVELPKWVDAASQENYEFAKQIANKPYKEYGGQTVADLGQGTKDAMKLFYDTLGTGKDSLNKAGQLFEEQGKGILGMDRSAYTNPFTEEVENRALDALNRTRTQALMSNADKARAAGAFGGSRAGVVDAITNAESIRSAGDLSAQLRKMGFDTATGNMQADLAAKGQAAHGLIGQAGALGQQRMQDFMGLQQIGGQQQGQQQRILDDLKRRFDEKEGYDTERLNLRLSALGMSPYGKTENVKKETQGGSSGSDFASIGLGILSLLPILFSSDREEKTDIKRLGKDPATGIPLYAYRYKGDPKSYPKVVGPMAQDIEKMFPGSTAKVGGKMVVKGALSA